MTLYLRRMRKMHKRLLSVFCLLLLLSSPAWGACSNTNLGNGIICIQRATADCTGGLTTCTVTLSSTGSGNLIIASIFWATTVGAVLSGSSHDCTQTASVTDTNSDVFANVAIQTWDTANTFISGTCYLASSSSGNTGVTFNLTAAADNGMWIVATELSGATATPLDKNITASVAGCPGSCGSSNSPSSGSTGVLAQANEYAYCFGTHNGPTQTFSAPTGGFAIGTQIGDLGALDQATTATTALTCGATLSTTLEWNMRVATFISSTQPGAGGSGGFGGKAGIGGKGGYGYRFRKREQ